MIYAFKCRTCGTPFEAHSRLPHSCPSCHGNNIGRDYRSVQLGTSAFKPHFNHAVGAYVDSSRKFDDMLKVRAEEAGSEYRRLDPGDAPIPSAGTEIIETQAREVHDRGIDPKTLV